MANQELLDRRCVARLIQVISDALGELKIEHGRFIHVQSTLPLWRTDEVVPKNGNTRQQLEGWIDEWPVYEFLYESISRRLSTCPYSTEKSPVPLQEIEGFSDLELVARDLVGELASLPWTYSFSVPFPETVGQPLARLIGNRSFGETHSVVKVDEEFQSTFPMPGDAKNALSSLFVRTLGEPPDPWEGRSAAITIRTNGFVGHFGWTGPITNATNEIESIFGILVALNLLKVNSPAREQHLRIPVVIHRQTHDGWTWVRQIELEHAISQAIHSLALSDATVNGTDMQLTGYFSWAINQLKALQASKDPTRLMLAGKWLLGSYREADPALSFVQATVVLEILLGERSSNERIGLSELLKNRCAYLIANDADEREEIKDKFAEIYAVRSKIVHVGKSLLSRREAALLEQLRIYGRRAIRREIELLNAPQPGPESA